MKKLITLFMTAASVAVAMGQQVITAWDFESSIIAPSVGAGSNTLVGSFGGAASSTGSLTGCAQQTGTGAWQIGSAAPGSSNESSGVQFLFSTEGYENIRFSYDHRTSNSGTRTARIQYTTDGMTWNNLDVTSENYTNDCPDRGAIDLGRIDVASPVGTNVADAWSRRNIDFSALPACDNNPLFGVRIMAAHHAETGEFRQANNVNNLATAGTWRLDNVTLKGDIILPPPAFVAFQGTHQTVSENAGTIQLNVNVTASNFLNSTVEVHVSAISTTGAEDAFIGATMLTFPPNSNTAQPLTISIQDDMMPEQTEYLVLQLANPFNAELSNNGRYILYIKDNDSEVPFQNNEVSLQLLSSYQNGATGSNSAEIVAHDPGTQRLAVANSIANKIDVLDFSNPAQIVPVQSIDISPFGGINSIAIRDGIIAAAIEFGVNPQDSGFVMFLNMDGQVLNSLRVGAMPDMITFNHAGNKVLVACEGEPNIDYTEDPVGTVCVVNLENGIANLQQSDVVFVGFDQFNGQEDALRQQGIRIFGPGASAAQDFEPEYITVSDDDLTAWVTLQENNAIAVVDLLTNQVTSLMPLGFKDHSLPGNGMDVSDQTNAINIANFPVRGLYMPDALDHFTIGGTTYLVTANEGDSREYTPMVESVRLSSAGYVLDPVAFPNAAALKTNVLSGRLNVLNTIGDTDGDGDFDEIYCLGSRSFSVWNAETGALVFDSGDQMEQITANHPVYGSLFNASNSTGAAAVKNRSDDKGPEPEGITTGWIDGQLYAFIALERIGGAMVYNITNPQNPYFVTYSNNRDFATNGPDRGAEGILLIAAADSPTGTDILLLANEVSSSLTVYQVNTCLQLTGIAVSPETATICQGQTVDLVTSAADETTFQWLLNGNEIPGANQGLLQVTEAGQYALQVANSAIGCTSQTAEIEVLVNALPEVTVSVTLSELCFGETTVLSAAGAESFQWNAPVQNDVPFAPETTFEYEVTGTDANGCQNTAQITVVVNALPEVGVAPVDEVICLNDMVVLAGQGANEYIWDNDVVDAIGFAATQSTTYTVTGTDENGCVNTAQITIQVNELPEVEANATETAVCAGEEVILFGSGAVSYAWNNEAENGEAFVPSQTQTYTVTGTDTNGCVNNAQIEIVVNALPQPTVSFASGVISTEEYATYQWLFNGLNIAGQQTQSWNPVINGYYAVTVVDANGCSATSEQLLVIASGVTDAQATGLQVYPNPFSDHIQIRVPGEANVRAELYNAAGALVFARTLKPGAEVMDTTGLAAGLYTFRLVTPTNNSVLKVVKN